MKPSKSFLTTADSELTWQQECMRVLAPPPSRSVSEWADEERMLSAESSAEPGQWYTDRAEYLRGIMDAACDPEVEEIAFMKSAQVGATEFLLNVVGYFIDQEPCPILLTQPTLAMGQAFSKDRVAPMIRDSPALRGSVHDVKTRESGNTMMHKVFPGGHLTIAGANSPASLASRPVRAYLGDEVDRYPISAGTEGDPVSLGKKRTQTFWNSLTLLTSTPTIKGASRIEAAFEDSDQRRFFVPCPHCDHMQYLQWSQVDWEDRHPSEAMYRCEECAALWTEVQRKNAIKEGEWRPTAIIKNDEGEEDLAPFNGRAGFHLNELYSPWSTLAAIVREFLESRKDPERLKTWTNTVLGETWEVKGEEIEHSALYARREYYAAEVPQKAVVLTAAVDVQDDRLEIGVEGWGAGEENWKIDYKVLYGDLSRPEIWKRLRDALDQRYEHESGVSLGIASAVIDSHGHYTQEVYKFVKPLEARRIYAIRGKESDGTFVNVPTRNNNEKVMLFSLGVDTGKEVLSARLRILEPGSGYQHFPMGEIFDETYFQGLTAEMLVTEKVRGVSKRVWVKKRPRNEPWDLAVYNLACMYILNPNFTKLAMRLVEKTEPANEGEDPKPTPTTRRSRPKRKRKNWATDI